MALSPLERSSAMMLYSEGPLGEFDSHATTTTPRCGSQKPLAKYERAKNDRADLEYLSSIGINKHHRNALIVCRLWLLSVL